jgi:MYXO-CTERM domain-containing protein
MGARTVSSLGCGAVFKGTVTGYLPSNARAGKAWVGIYADYNSRIPESDETDNTKAVVINVNSSVPDLSMASILVGSSVAGAGSKLPVSFTVRNTGKAKASAFKVQFYYNTSNRRTGWVAIGNPVSIAAIDPGKSSSLTQIQLTMPSTVRSGTGYLHYFVDSANDVGEYSETNNYGVRSFLVTGKADLSASVLRLTPNAQAPGGLVRIEYRIANNGTTKADNFQLNFYYSTDATIGSGDASLGQVTITTVASKGAYPATGNASLTVRLPSNARIGTGYIGVLVDSTRRVSETNENNNTRAEKVTVTSPGPDLIPSTVVLPSSPVVSGQKVTISVTVSNLGSASSGVTTGSVVYSTDGLIDAQDKAVGSFNIPALSSKGTRTISVSITMPAGLNAGNGYLGVIVDSTKKVKETVETNNTATRIILIVEDKDKDGFTWAPGCPTTVKDCDCDDTDKNIHPKATELCDGKDNNCDGKIDPTPPCGCTSGQQRSCYTGPAGTDGKGTCKKGTQSCVNGKWGSCVGETKPKAEDCNGKDDDCDGSIDENLTQQKCYSGAAGTAGKGSCKEGTRSCSNGQWSTCVGEVLPSAEKCDGKDNDCDGQIDNAFNTSNPLKQSCASACGVGLETCTNGTWQGCTAPQNCGEPQPEPNPDGNEPPADFGEPTGDAGADTVPEGGNCYTNGCPTGEICQKGKCVADPCDGVNCSGKGEFCRDGQCVQSCGCMTCPTGEICLDGQCVTDPCDGVTCAQDEVCNNISGQCVKNSCASSGCGDKRTCINGSCVDDPCLNIQCPQGDVCDKGQCVGQQCSSEPGQENTGEHPPRDIAEPTTDADGGVTNDDKEPTTDTANTDRDTTDTGSTDKGNKDAGQQDKTSGSDGSSGDLKQLPEVPQGCNCSLSPASPPNFLLFFFAMLALFGAVRRFRR